MDVGRNGKFCFKTFLHRSYYDFNCAFVALTTDIAIAVNIGKRERYIGSGIYPRLIPDIIIVLGRLIIIAARRKTDTAKHTCHKHEYTEYFFHNRNFKTAAKIANNIKQNCKFGVKCRNTNFKSASES